MGPEVRPLVRWLILLGGLALVVTGTVATFVGRLALPAGIAIVVGAAGCLLAAIGRWPASLSWGNASVAFAITNQIRNEIDDVLAEAPAAAIPALERVRDIVSAVQVDQTPRVAAAIAYDDEIEAALRRVVPDARIRRDTEWSRDRPDFWLLVEDRELRIETKHVGSATSFSGSSLDALFDQMSGSSRLLVITNAVDASRGRERVAGRMGERGAVITWRSPADDGELRRGISLLLDPAGDPTRGVAG